MKPSWGRPLTRKQLTAALAGYAGCIALLYVAADAPTEPVLDVPVAERLLESARNDFDASRSTSARDRLIHAEWKLTEARIAEEQRCLADAR